MSPVNSARSEKRSSVESQKAPNADCLPVMKATLPSMKSKMFAQIMMTPASAKLFRASAQAAAQLISTPMRVSVLGEMPSATLMRMMARSGNIENFPMVPVKVIEWGKYNERFDYQLKPRAARGGGGPATKKRYFMPVQNLKSQIAHLPEQPGVYLFANADGETIYIGKARSLRDRVRSYLGARGVHPKTDALLDEAAGLEVIVTDSVVEALALENNLVKERSPRYNVRLRDDKNYPYLQLTTNEPFQIGRAHV